MTFIESVRKLIAQYDRGLMTEREFKQEIVLLNTPIPTTAQLDIPQELKDKLSLLEDRLPTIHAQLTETYHASDCGFEYGQGEPCTCPTPAQLAEAEFRDSRYEGFGDFLKGLPEKKNKYKGSEEVNLREK